MGLLGLDFGSDFDASPTDRCVGGGPARTVTQPCCDTCLPFTAKVCSATGSACNECGGASCAIIGAWNVTPPSSLSCGSGASTHFPIGEPRLSVQSLSPQGDLLSRPTPRRLRLNRQRHLSLQQPEVPAEWLVLDSFPENQPAFFPFLKISRLFPHF